MTPEEPSRREPSLGDLQAIAAHADQRAALYRRKVLLGRGEPRRLAELDRIAAGAASRVKTAIQSQQGATPAHPHQQRRGQS